MIKYKHFISLILACAIILCTIPLCLFTFADSSKTFIVWEADSDRVLTECDRNINAFNSGENGQIIGNVSKQYDSEGGFYRTELSLSDKGGQKAQATAKAKFSSNLSGFGWMANKDTLNAIKPYLKISFQYRLNSTGEIPQDAKLCIFASTKNKLEVAKLITVPMDVGSSWQMIDFENVESDFSAVWSDGYFSVGLYSEKSSFSGNLILDIKGLRLAISSDDQVNINKALNNVKNINRIANFTRGVSISKYQGINNYYSLFTGYDKKSAYSNQESDGYGIVNLIESENCDISVSQTKAKTTVGDTNGETIVVEVSVLSGYKVSDLVITDVNNKKVKWLEIKTNEQYSFRMPSSSVKVEVKIEPLNFEDVQLLYQIKAASHQDAPWYWGSERPYEYAVVPGENEAAYLFRVTQNSGTITVYGIGNKTSSMVDYYDTAMITIRMKTETDTPRTINICADSATEVSQYFEITNEWKTFTLPLKELAASGNFTYLSLTFDDFEIGDNFLLGTVNVWSIDTGKSDEENYQALMDMSDYEKSQSNDILGIIAYFGKSDYPWDEDESGYVNRDAAWYLSFRDEVPWLVSTNKVDEILPYQLCFYDANIPITENGRINVSEYIDTGYMEFYIKSSSEKCTIPFTLQSFGNNERQWVPFTITYDVSKARDDGFMCFRIPFTYFKDLGLDMTSIGLLAITGCQELPEEIYLSPVRFYTNYAEIEDPIEVTEDEELEERDIPIELDSSIINAVLDKDFYELLVPENTYLWEILSAITFDSNDITVDFMENDEILIDENEIITQGMVMRLYRRGQQIQQFEVYYRIEE